MGNSEEGSKPVQIKNLFAKDINRSINGVIKVAQDDTASIEQELSEYVVTNELQRHFADFFEAYDRAIDVPTDKVGVWVSGFFGSGKSHFLKMLSYLLANREVGGVAAVDYFDGKVADPMVYSRMRRAAAVPTESILFNIDSKGGHWKGGSEAKTALLLAFARVFYEHLGFYGEDLKLARMEQFVESQGKTDEFRAAFARVNGGDWLADRANYEFFEDDIVEVMQEVLGMSREAAQHWFDGSERAVISPDELTEQIVAYADRRAGECGGSWSRARRPSTRSLKWPATTSRRSRVASAHGCRCRPPAWMRSSSAACWRRPTPPGRCWPPSTTSRPPC